MKVFKFSEKSNIEGSAICLGDFDGVHKGHKKLFEAAKRYENWGVLLFDRNTKGSPVITTLEEKLDLIRQMGAGYAVVVEFSPDFSKKTPREFVEFLKDTLGVGAVVAGYDYRFGYKASGDCRLLQELTECYGISAVMVDVVVSKEGEPIKSTTIRKMIETGNFACIKAFMGRDYFVTGIVVEGLRNGRQMGFPTANISYDENKIMPPDGVYYVKVDGRDSVANIGNNPTFDATKRTLEVHIIGETGDLYGQKMTVEFIEKIRDDIKFATSTELSQQIKKDVDWVLERR